MEKLYDGIYVSDWQSSCNYDVLDDNNIKCIINISGRKKPQEILDILTKLEIYHYTVETDNEENFQLKDPHNVWHRVIKIMSSFIEDGFNVLLHTSSNEAMVATAIGAYVLYTTYVINKKTPAKYIITQYTKHYKKIRNYQIVDNPFMTLLYKFETLAKNKKIPEHYIKDGKIENW